MVAKEYTGRTPKPWYLKINPIWWLGNSYEPNPPAEYLASRPWLWRQVCWYLRNPLVNFQDFVIGVNDRNYTAYSSDWPKATRDVAKAIGLSPVEVTDWHDYQQTGWKFGALHVGILWLPYVSYSGKHVLWHVGWYAIGRFQIKFNILG